MAAIVNKRDVTLQAASPRTATTNLPSSVNATTVGGAVASVVVNNATNGASAWGKFSGSGSTLPAGNVEFNFAGSSSKGGNATNTNSVGSQSASSVQNATINFNARNDRNSAAVVNPAVANAVGTIDHTVNADGSADISFEWTWAGTESDIDGFIVYVHDSGPTAPSSQKVITAAADSTVQIYYVTPARMCHQRYAPRTQQVF